MSRLSDQMLPDDAVVLRQAAEGDPEAFRLLVDRHSRSVYQIAYRLTGRREDAEDVVQETFVKAFRQLARFEARSSVATWLYRIGFNCAIDFVRKRGNREAPEMPMSLDQRPASDRVPDADDLVFAGQIGAEVERAMAGLSTQERAAFVMRHVHDCSIDDISRELGLKTNAAKHAVFRAVRKMRVALGPLVQKAPSCL